MTFNPEKHHRRSIRLKGYDYAQAGWYFITICTQDRLKIFGRVEKGEMVLNNSGRLIEYYWLRLSRYFNHIESDVYIVMPDHIHGIIHIVNDAVGAKHLNHQNCSTKNALHKNASPLPQRPAGTQPKSLSSIIQNYKSVTTRKMNQMDHTPGRKIWQRGYWEHIVRDENDLNRIRTYIRNNPLKWQDDRYFE